MTVLERNGNLPVGGKILPVGLAADGTTDDADVVVPDTPTASAVVTATPAEVLKSRVARTLTSAPRPRKSDSEQTADTTTEASAADTKSVDKDTDEASGNSTTPLASLTPDATNQNAMTASGIIMTTNLTPQQPQALPTPASPPQNGQQGTMVTSVQTAGTPVQPALTLVSASPLAPIPSAVAVKTAVTGAGKAPARNAPAVPEAATGEAAASTQTLAQARIQAPPQAPTQAPTQAGTAHTAVAADQDPAVTAGASPAETAAPVLRDALSFMSAPAAGAAANAAPSANLSGYESSRDMSALVDRLVETRAAMRSTSPSQWVQTSVQTAEFGRVALRIRQDGNDLSVAMSSQDPAFAPAAQAALHASQSLLQPVAASRSGSDNMQDNNQSSQPSQSGQQGQSNGQNASGQSFNQSSSGGQPGGQDRQTPWRQQAPFTLDNQSAAPQTATKDESAGTLPSDRSGLLV